jgi:hypothetical protein
MKNITIKSSENDIILNIEPTDNAVMSEIDSVLPIESKARLWGDEVYFDIGIEATSSEETLDVDIGDVAYWPEGQCLCVFFGKTPASTLDRPRPASEVVIVGKVKDIDIDLLHTVKEDDKIIVS